MASHSKLSKYNINLQLSVRPVDDIGINEIKKMIERVLHRYHTAAGIISCKVSKPYGAKKQTRRDNVVDIKAS